MKPTLPLLLYLFFFSSCAQYQYLTVSGINIPKNNENQLVSETDTLRVQYLFLPGQVSVRVYNKLREPLEVVWNQSALVLNDQAVGYYNPNQTFSAQTQSETWRSGQVNTTMGSVRGELQAGEQVQFIPPLSFIESRPLPFPLQALTGLSYEKAKKGSLLSANGGYNTVEYKWFSYQKESSPARFRSYLTFRLGRGETAKDFAVEHQFFISDAWKSGAGPDYFTQELANRGDRFYFLQY